MLLLLLLIRLMNCFQENYLEQYGYLTMSNVETGNLRTEDQLKEAIRSLQRFGNIPATGIIDEATHELMERPRCGQPDNIDSNSFSTMKGRLMQSKRSKRYIIQGHKWPSTTVTWR